MRSSKRLNINLLVAFFAFITQLDLIIKSSPALAEKKNFITSYKLASTSIL